MIDIINAVPDRESKTLIAVFMDSLSDFIKCVIIKVFMRERINVRNNKKEQYDNKF